MTRKELLRASLHIARKILGSCWGNGDLPGEVEIWRKLLNSMDDCLKELER